jgi:hypothetical protein
LFKFAKQWNSPTNFFLKATGLNTEIMKGSIIQFSNKSKNSAGTKSILVYTGCANTVLK